VWRRKEGVGEIREEKERKGRCCFLHKGKIEEEEEEEEEEACLL
jgi:hypothetical protein